MKTLSSKAKGVLAALIICIILIVASTVVLCLHLVGKLKSGVESNLEVPLIEEETQQCFGISCDEFVRVERKLEELNKLLSTKGYRNNVTPDRASPEDEHLENDVRYTEAQVDSARDLLLEDLKQKTDENHIREKRLIKHYTHSQKWKLPIKYYCDGTLDDEEIQSIRHALAIWENTTCIRFKEVAQEPDFTGDNHVYFTKRYQSCWTYVGKVSNLHLVNFGDRCFKKNKVGTAMHEIGHVLGLYHEQQREDRGDNIQIIYENINSFQSQFLRMPTHNYGLAYDYTSVMHYQWNAAGGNARQTIKALREPSDAFTVSMGQRVELSYIDVKRVNVEYCKNECPHLLKNPCEKGGYQDPLVCSQCRCPDGYAGRKCQTVKESRDSCRGGTIELESAVSKVITSPGYNNTGGQYEDFTECYWRVIAADGEKVRLEFRGEFSLYKHNLEVCYHWLEVKYEYDMEKPGPRFCGYRRPETTLTSRTREMMIIFKSNYPTEWINVRRGFNITVSSVPAGT